MVDLSPLKTLWASFRTPPDIQPLLEALDRQHSAAAKATELGDGVDRAFAALLEGKGQ